MAYDFGSQTLGIKNPFKTEGRLKTVTGALLIIAGVLPLLSVAELLENEPVFAYTNAVLGFVLLAAGSRHLGVGLFQLFRYFVGRSVPTSLAYNKSRSERETALAEKKAVLYSDEKLHSMLMGRKNTTFVEPEGWVARLIHSVFPNLIFLPYPLRHVAQELGVMFLNFGTALISFLIVYFVVSTGLAGVIAKETAIPILSILLLLYLVFSWRRSANSISSHSSLAASSKSLSFGVLIGLSIIVPVFSGFALDKISGWTAADIAAFTGEVNLFSAWGNLGLLFGAIVLVAVAVAPALIARSKNVTPSTDVSEFRENLQESVHPNEIFINIENIVLANRRYKEIPNRIYREFDPQLIEQAEGKGNFNGELLVETQPELAKQEMIGVKITLKILITIMAQLFVLVSYAFFAILVYDFANLVSHFMTAGFGLGTRSEAAAFFALFNPLLFSFIAWLTFQAAGRLLNNSSSLFWGELQFSSLLMYMKTDGTYTESKISTGMSIHDSTRSENVVVRSSITPWVITSRLLTSIFATSGSSNLESPRFIMGMLKNDEELANIINEIKTFLKGREAIASITNEADLNNASTIHQINQQSRALPESDQSTARLTTKDEQAAGFLRNNEEDKKD
ncbi:MAG: hypothetical protein ACJAVV_003794 [Alphaproteobacteria bacterium]|jgi:hypothetical protein